jgi:hypothetical protein
VDRLRPRCEIEPLGHDCWQVTLHFGFKNEPDVPEALKLLEGRGINLDDMETSYFLSRDTVIPTCGGGMALWREKLFASMHRNASGGGRLPEPADQPHRRAGLEGRDLMRRARSGATCRCPAVVAGFVAVLVGYTSSVVIVFQAAAALGATPAQTASWMWALGLGMGLTSAGLSLWYRSRC